MNQSTGLNISPASFYQVSLPPQPVIIMKPDESKKPASAVAVSSNGKTASTISPSEAINLKEPLNLSTKTDFVSNRVYTAADLPAATLLASVKRTAEEKNRRMPVKKRKFSQHSESSNVALPTTPTMTTRSFTKKNSTTVPTPTATLTTTAGTVTTTTAIMSQVTRVVTTQAAIPTSVVMPLPSRSDTPLDPSTSLMIATECHLATLPDEDGDTPLHIAVAQGNILLVQRLIHLISLSSKSVDIYNDLRQTPLHLAVITKNWQLTRMLAEAGANPNFTDRNGQTAVHLICQRSNVDCLRALLNFSKFKINLEARNYEGFTPLHVAEFAGSVEMLKLLVMQGANINSQDNKSGRTALVHAVESDNLPIIEFLLSSGADVNIQSYSGNTALHVASGRGFLHMVRLLLKHGADMSMRNSHCDTAASVAKNSNVTKVLRGVYQQPWLPSLRAVATNSEAAGLPRNKTPPVVVKVQPVVQQQPPIRTITVADLNKAFPGPISYTIRQNVAAVGVPSKTVVEGSASAKKLSSTSTMEIEGMEVDETA